MVSLVDHDAALAALAGGEVVAIPTDTVYGLAGRAEDQEACQRIFQLKGRPERVALPVLVADVAMATRLAAPDVATALERLAVAFWPGPLTVVVARAPGVDLELGGDAASIGLRCPGDEIAQALCREVGPLATTSANAHGAPPCHSAQEVAACFCDQRLAVLDGGARDGTPSSVVSLLGTEPVLLRAGPVGFAAVCEALA